MIGSSGPISSLIGCGVRPVLPLGDTSPSFPGLPGVPLIPSQCPCPFDLCLFFLAPQLSHNTTSRDHAGVHLLPTHQKKRLTKSHVIAPLHTRGQGRNAPALG